MYVYLLNEVNNNEDTTQPQNQNITNTISYFSSLNLIPTSPQLQSIIVLIILLFLRFLKSYMYVPLNIYYLALCAFDLGKTTHVVSWDWFYGYILCFSPLGKGSSPLLHEAIVNFQCYLIHDCINSPRFTYQEYFNVFIVTNTVTMSIFVFISW